MARMPRHGDETRARCGAEEIAAFAARIAGTGATRKSHASAPPATNCATPALCAAIFGRSGSGSGVAEQRFDLLTITLSRGLDRRRALLALTAGVSGIVAAFSPDPGLARRGRRKKGRKR